MILRKQNIHKNAEEVSMMISFTEADVKRAMQHYYAKFADICGNTFARNTSHSELDLLYFFEHTMFKNFVQKYREQLSAWAFAMAIRHKFILASQDEDESKKIYFLSDKLCKKVGRPRLLDDDD
ncbi:hypothetical protein [Prevotella sp. tf2-5]|uniref:hypothetical protein n=1 Tax=Prevotella sp. tf2-5 TaxID=1761889 RepID=UPI0008EBCD7B|nr:hypothetical protein [Prevotella sp. tf2-5]SFO58360.1 hypothetical protein SAMN04487852_10343 [Prevotella sp. tf2-5]